MPRNVGASLEHYSLCRCGHSQNKPFCSGMHGYVEFHDPPLSDEPTLFEWAGGFTALRRMTHIFYEKHVPDDPLLAPLFANMSPDHPERVAAWLGETSGGPERYTERYGGYDRMVSQHIGKDLSEDQRARWARHHAPRRRLARREDRGVRTLDLGRNPALTDGEIHYHTTFRRAPHPTKEEPPDRRDNDRCVRHAELRVPVGARPEPANLFVAGFIGSPAMNLFTCASDQPIRVGGCALDLATEVTSRLASFGGDRVVVGFRPEAVHVGDGPVAAHIRTVEDLGSEAFVHVAFDHEAETVFAVSKMPAPFKGVTGDPIDVRFTGTVHVFDPAGPRIASGTARCAT